MEYVIAAFIDLIFLLQYVIIRHSIVLRRSENVN